MSHCPGPTLEDWLTDWWSLVVQESEHGSGIRWAYANQLVLTKEQFAGLVAIYEAARELIQEQLRNYLDQPEDEQGSWRDYSGYAFDGIPKEIEETGNVYIRYLADKVERTKGLLGSSSSEGKKNDQGA